MVVFQTPSGSSGGAGGSGANGATSPTGVKRKAEEEADKDEEPHDEVKSVID